MLKKVFGVLFLLVGAVFLLSAVQRVSGAPSVLYAVGPFLPTVLFTMLGLFCLQKSPDSAATHASENNPQQ